MKLSTANLSKKLRGIRPKLAGKLSRSADSQSTDKGTDKSGEARPKARSKMQPKKESDKALEKGAQKGPKSESLKSAGLKESGTNSDSKSASQPSAIPAFLQRSKRIKNSQSARVAFHLLLVKPWVLVAGLWLVSAASALVAMEGLVSPSKLTEALPEPVAETAPVATNRFIDVEQSAEGITDDGTEDSSDAVAEMDAADAIAADVRFPVWPLATLVGSCAAGCVAISRRKAMIRMAAARTRNRGRQLQAAAPIKKPVSNSKPIRRVPSVGKKGAPLPIKVVKSAARPAEKAASGLVRSKKRRQRKRPTAQPISAVKGTGRNASGSPVLASRSSAQQAAPKSHVSRPSRTTARSRKAIRRASRQPVVSVVPADQSHRLDWKNGSIAHDMDVRPPRAM